MDVFVASWIGVVARGVALDVEHALVES